MYEEPNELKDRIVRLSNEELRQMVNVDHEQYREEALGYARAEMERRGLKIAPVASEDYSREEEEEIAAPDGEYLRSSEAVETEANPTSEVGFKVFRGSLASWDELFSEAAAFATEIGPFKLINISHSEDDNEGVVTVWYWT